MRGGIRALLQQIPGVAEIFEAHDDAALQKMMAKHLPDVLLVDLAMVSGGRRADKVLPLRLLYPDVAIVIMSAHFDEETTRAALEAGANGIVRRADLESELHQALRTVAAGKRYVSSSAPAPSSMALDVPSTVLTQRQREILTLIARGFTNRQICAMLGIHVKTVESHRTGLMKRLNIHNVAGLVRYAIRHGLLGPDDY